MNQTFTDTAARRAAISVDSFQKSVREFGEFVEGVESSYSSRRAVLIPLLTFGSALLIAAGILVLAWQLLR